MLKNSEAAKAATRARRSARRFKSRLQSAALLLVLLDEREPIHTRAR